MDMLLLCTDGLWGQFNEKMLGLKMLNQISIQRLASELAQDAYELASPRSDNVTLIITRWRESSLEKKHEPMPEKIPSHVISAVKANNSMLQDAMGTLRSAIDFSLRKNR